MSLLLVLEGHTVVALEFVIGIIGPVVGGRRGQPVVHRIAGIAFLGEHWRDSASQPVDAVVIVRVRTVFGCLAHDVVHSIIEEGIRKLDAEHTSGEISNSPRVH